MVGTAASRPLQETALLAQDHDGITQAFGFKYTEDTIVLSNFSNFTILQNFYAVNPSDNLALVCYVVAEGSTEGCPLLLFGDLKYGLHKLLQHCYHYDIRLFSTQFRRLEQCERTL
jgi:hypothetical protein